MIHQSPAPFAPLTSKLPLSHMVPPGSCSPKGVWRAIILSIPLEEENHHPQYIFGEREILSSLFLGIFIPIWLDTPSSLIPYFPCYFYSASKVIGNQREMNDSMKEKEKKLVWTSIILSSTFAIWSEEYFVKNSRFMPKIYFKSLFSLQKNLNLPIDYEFEKCLIFF